MGTRTNRCGFTLVESLISIAILGIVSMTLATAIASSLRSSSSTAEMTHVESQTLRGLVRAAAKLQTAGVSTLDLVASDPLNASPRLQFQTVESATGGTVTWSAPSLLTWEIADGETDDGTDEDGDGLIDEGDLVLVQNPGGPDERRTTFAKGVTEFLQGETRNGLDDNGNGLIDERGFCVTRDGRRLTLWLSTARVSSEGESFIHTATRTVRLRN